MEKNILETLMGAVVLLVAGTFLMFAYQGSDMRMEAGYNVKAKFANASGIALGSDVRIGGVKVGVVTDLGLDPQSYEAVVRMQINNSTQLPKDSSASIVSSGLLGEKYIQLSPGNDDKMIADGAEKPLSFEICGGPHVDHTLQLLEDGKRFKILKEESSSAGIRRIKAVLQ